MGDGSVSWRKRRVIFLFSRQRNIVAHTVIFLVVFGRLILVNQEVVLRGSLTLAMFPVPYPGGEVRVPYNFHRS